MALLMRRYLAMMGTAIFCVACVSLYMMLEDSTRLSSDELQQSELNVIETRLREMEKELNRNHATINLIKAAIQNVASSGDLKQLKVLQKALSYNNFESQPINSTEVTFDKEICLVYDNLHSKSDIQMIEELGIIPFDDVDGGVWKQGYPIAYEEHHFTTDNPLKVFVLPHSHCDPGWIKTVDLYYKDQVRRILDNMVVKLEEMPRMKFMFAEISFFSMWWSEIDNAKQQKVLKFIKDGRFEIVTGGWVMTDEANAHYYAMLEQLIEGHQWVANHLGVVPMSGWAIDPFGHSSSMAYLLKRVGLDNMLIQRIHYSVKKHLSRGRNLEFYWRQNWDSMNSTDILTHMMPFYSYDAPHSCGPDPKICCQFDFLRMTGSKITCPWRIPPQSISQENVASRAKLLLDQYRKKSRLYRNNVLLVPLGDDFRYDKAIEWDLQYKNYIKLFDYMLSQPDWHIQIQFGTLSDYFNELRSRNMSVQRDPIGYPSLSGDFFTYADRNNDYWSGYFTSRPFYKVLDRVLEDRIRAAEIIFSFVLKQGTAANSHQNSQLFDNLVNARRNLGLFQHHDAITGTAKDHVVVDYGQKLLEAIRNADQVTTESIAFLISENFEGNQKLFLNDEARLSHDSLPKKTVLKLNKQFQYLIVYNSMGHDRNNLVELHVTCENVEVQDHVSQVIYSQSEKTWLGKYEYSHDVFAVFFEVQMKAISLSRYRIRCVEPDENPMHHNAVVQLYNSPSDMQSSLNAEKVPTNCKIREVNNNFLTASFSCVTGTLQKLYTKDHTLSISIEFVTYGTVSSREKSGAYLFLPDGSAKPLKYPPPFIRLSTGSLRSTFTSCLPNVEHTTILVNSQGLDGLGIFIKNLVDLRPVDINYELSMRLKTSITNREQRFYTDLNGFQMQERKTNDKIALQGNFYPMPQLAFLEDKLYRLNIITAQSLGVGALVSGQIEIIQDRRLKQDDGRGVMQGVQDNKATPNNFKLIWEMREASKPATEPSTLPSLIVTKSAEEFLHPQRTFAINDRLQNNLKLKSEWKGLLHQLPCEIHLLNFRAMKLSESALLLHHQAYDCNFPASALSCHPNGGKVDFEQIFGSIQDLSVCPLNLLGPCRSLNPKKVVTIPPMEITAIPMKH